MYTIFYVGQYNILCGANLWTGNDHCHWANGDIERAKFEMVKNVSNLIGFHFLEDIQIMYSKCERCILKLNAWAKNIQCLKLYDFTLTSHLLSLIDGRPVSFV